MCAAVNIIFYCLIFLSILVGAVSWMALQKYAAAVAKNCGQERELFDTRAGDESGASVFEVSMFKEIMQKKYLTRSEELINLGVKTRFIMLLAVGSVVVTVVAAAIRHAICDV